MEKLKKSMLWLWQLPQNLCGAALKAHLRDRTVAEIPSDRFGAFPEAAVRYVKGFPGGISLGGHVFVNSRYRVYKGLTERHELGHCRQSVRLGPLYLFVIGIPSIVHAWLYHGDRDGYYKFYTEAWADRLGGVER